MSLTSDQFVELILDAVIQGLPTPVFEPLPVFPPVSTSSSSPKPSGSCNGKVKHKGKSQSNHFKSLSNQSKRQSNLIKSHSNYPDPPITLNTTDPASLPLPPLADSVPDLSAYLASIEDPAQ